MTSYTHSVAVDRDLDSVWRMVTSVEDFPRFMPGVESVTRIGSRGGRDRWHWVVRGSDGLRDFYTITTEERPRQCLAWHPVDTPGARTIVLLSPLGPARTLVTLRVKVDVQAVEGCLAGTLEELGAEVRAALDRFARPLASSVVDTPGGGRLRRGRPVEAMYPVEGSHVGDDPANPLDMPFPPRTARPSSPGRGRAAS